MLVLICGNESEQASEYPGDSIKCLLCAYLQIHEVLFWCDFKAKVLESAVIRCGWE